jgi:hypothetical protein
VICLTNGICFAVTDAVFMTGLMNGMFSYRNVVFATDLTNETYFHVGMGFFVTDLTSCVCFPIDVRFL